MITAVIHNTKNLERGRLLQQQIDEQGINPIFVEAVMRPTMPRKGISQAHKTAIKLGDGFSKEAICIMEDDVEFRTPGAYHRFLKLYESLPEDADLFLSGIYSGTAGEVVGNIAPVLGQAAGLHCYIIRRKFYERALQADERYNIDFWMTSPDFGAAKTYVAVPFLAIQRDGYSDNVKQVTKYNQEIKMRYKRLL